LVEEPDNLILRHLRDLRTDIAEVKADMNSLRADMRSEMNSFRADVASDFAIMRKETSDQIAALRKETREQIVGVRRALTEYHSAVVGHGILISDLEERVQRIEQRLEMSPGAH
jgi:chromosome segregation ATPase